MDDEWAERRRSEQERATAAGQGRRWTPDQARPSVATSSRQLRHTERARQRLQVQCRERCVAVVLQGATPGAMQVAIESTKTGNAPGDGYAMHMLDLTTLGNTAVVVGCRNGEWHHLDPHKLRSEAWEGRPGKPRVVHVSRVAAAPLT